MHEVIWWERIGVIFIRDWFNRQIADVPNCDHLYPFMMSQSGHEEQRKKCQYDELLVICQSVRLFLHESELLHYMVVAIQA